MNKKLLGLIMAGVIATTSLPAVTAFAATSKVAPVNKTTTSTLSVASSFPYPWAAAIIKEGTELYSEPYSDCYAWTVSNDIDVSITHYNNYWTKVKFSDGSTYHVYGSGRFHY